MAAATKKRVLKADKLAYLWWNRRRVQPKHQVVAIDGADFAALERTVRRLSAQAKRPHQQRPISLVIDPEHPLPGWPLDEYLWAPPLRPSKCCTCPGGSGTARALHGIREALHMAPVPVSKWDCYPSCPFCGTDGVAFSPYRSYDYPYGYTANAGLTILLVDPPPSEARRLTYATQRPLAPWACHDLPPVATNTVLNAFDGSRSAVALPLADREAILVALRQSHHLVRESILRHRLQKRDSSDQLPSDQLALAYQNDALSFVIPFWTNVCYFPDRNFPDGGKLIRPIFTKMIHQGRLTLEGNFAIASGYYEAWREHLVPLGAVFTSS